MIKNMQLIKQWAKISKLSKSYRSSIPEVLILVIHHGVSVHRAKVRDLCHAKD